MFFELLSSNWVQCRTRDLNVIFDIELKILLIGLLYVTMRSDRLSSLLICYFLFCLGIVLKNARITKKGKSKANVASGSVVETLVITSSNIVQIVAEVSPFIYLLPFLFIILELRVLTVYMTCFELIGSLASVKCYRQS